MSEVDEPTVEMLGALNELLGGDRESVEEVHAELQFALVRAVNGLITLYRREAAPLTRATEAELRSKTARQILDWVTEEPFCLSLVDHASEEA